VTVSVLPLREYVFCCFSRPVHVTAANSGWAMHMLVLSSSKWPSTRMPVKLPQAMTSGWANAAQAKAAKRIIEPVVRIISLDSNRGMAGRSEDITVASESGGWLKSRLRAKLPAPRT
jgi:hypothetical protein